MKFNPALSLIAVLLPLLGGAAAYAQDAVAPTPVDSTAVPEAAAAAVDNREYDDYTVKAYSLTVFGGNFSGATFLELDEVGPKTVITAGIGNILGAGEVLGYDGRPLLESRAIQPDGKRLYDAPLKEIRSGPAFGGRVGIYISDHFHLDLAGTYATGKAVTSMVYMGEDNPTQKRVKNVRYQLDEDAGFVMYKGGLALSYDALPAEFWGIVPRLGFGLGGIINRFSRLEDKTSLYLEGSFALTKAFGDRLSLVGQADVTNFSFKVEELGYSNMLNYATFSLGLGWFIDVLPEDVRARRDASRER
ncbi:MAG: hypothetical protein IH621_17055 [Krumholzibacteria bacterium]|nr:hypothetical protein [Candidatus Krumholzibacteria bacterium]